MRLLVTGGAGFIGSNFVHYVYKQRPDWHITVYDKLTYAGNLRSLDGLDKSRYDFIKGDICSQVAINKAVAACDAVIHFAAETHVDNSLQAAWPFVDTNIIGTYWLLEAVRKYSKRLHHISTDEVYGDLSQRVDDRFNETSPYDPRNPYSATKAGSDHLVRAWIHSYDIEATISNCSNNYGPYQHVEKIIPRTITNVLTGTKPKLYGKGQNSRDWIHAADHASAILAILERGKLGETYLIGADGEMTNKQLVQTILGLMEKPVSDYQSVSDRLGHDMRYAVDSSKLRSELGWVPIYSFVTGLKATIDWYRAHEAWWKPQKQITENNYSKLGQ